MECILDKSRVARAFQRSHATYDQYATVQQQMADDLVRALATHAPESLGQVLEIGCGTGLVTRRMVEEFSIAHYTLNDLVPELAVQTSALLRDSAMGAPDVLSGDMESLEDYPDGLSLVVSGATFQWSKDPARFLPRLLGHLAPGGLLAFTTFGPDNLAEFRALTGVGLDYPGLDALQDYLAGEAEVVESGEWHAPLHFAHPMAVLRHLQRTGVNGAGDYRWSPQSLREFCAAYRQGYGEVSGVRLTYHPILVIARRR